MSILIKGIEMPKSCSDCFAEQRIGSDFGCGIIGFDDANTTCFTKDRRKDCPLIELQPHGRLIDADAFVNRLDDGKSRNDSEIRGARRIINQLFFAPTIIPAEEGE